jgi:hypothetical protein
MGVMVSGKRSTVTTQISSSLTASIAKSEKRFSGFEVVWEAIAASALGLIADHDQVSEKL